MWLNQRTVDAIRIMAALAGRWPQITKASQLCETTGLTLVAVQKVANLLVQSGLVAAARGPHGGLTLSRAPSSITVGEIARAFEPEDCPVNFLPVSTTDGRISTLLFQAHREFFRPLEHVTLAELIPA